MITRLAHVCIGALDIKATEEFYCGALGLKKKFGFRRDGREFGFYLDTGGGTYIEVFEQKEMEGGENAAIKHLCLEVEDLARVIKRLEDRGSSVTERVRGKDNSWQAWVVDPSGVRIEFHEYTVDSSQLTGKDCLI